MLRSHPSCTIVLKDEMVVATLIGLLWVAGALVYRRGYRELAVGLEVAAYLAAVVWAFIGSPFMLLLMIAAPMPGMHKRAAERGHPATAVAFDVIGLAALVGAFASISAVS
jgi:hypothetical protein